jgi:hypothetical protein
MLKRLTVTPIHVGQSGCFQWRAETLHSITTVDGCGLLGANVGCVTEELLHLAGGGEDDKHARGCWADGSEGMRHPSRAENGLPGFELYSLGTNLEEDFAVDDVEPLFLFEVEMKGWATGEEVAMFDSEEAGGFFGGCLEEYLPVARGVAFAEPILTGSDDVDLFCGGVG